MIVVAFMGCDQEHRMIKPVIEEIMTDDVPVVDTTQGTPLYSQYDVNQDGKIDRTDLDMVSAALGERQPAHPRTDVDGNGIVDGSDIILVAENFDETVIDEVEDEAPALTIDFGDLAKRPTIPEGADILEGEKIEYYASLEEVKFGRIYDSPYLAANSEAMKSLISRSKEWAIEACGLVETGARKKHENVGFNVLAGFGFKTRQERETFKTALPGRWIIEADATNDHRTLNNPKDLEAFWLIAESVVVIGEVIGEEEVYYFFVLMPNAYNPCLYVE